MTFSVYATLSHWWADEKKLLRSNLERWGAANVQDRLRQVRGEMGRPGPPSPGERRDGTERERKRERGGGLL